MSAIRGLHAAVGDSEQPQWPCQFCGKYIDCCSCYFRASDVMVVIRKLRAAVPRWIPVDERMPEQGVRVLVYDADFRDCEIGEHYADMGWCGVEAVTLRPSHWMPLPSAPPEPK